MHTALMHVEQAASEFALAEGRDLVGEGEFLFELFDRQARNEIEQ